jgi:hypothetical protein
MITQSPAGETMTHTSTDEDWPVGTPVEFGTRGRGTIQQRPNLGEMARPSERHVWVDYDVPMTREVEYEHLEVHGYGKGGLTAVNRSVTRSVTTHGGWFAVDSLRKVS